MLRAAQANFISTVQEAFDCPAMDVLCTVFSALADWPVIGIIIISIFIFDSDRRAYRLLGVVLFSLAINLLLKNIFQVDRPFVVDPSLLNGSPESGFSFPSGHSQIAVTFWLWLTCEDRHCWHLSLFSVFVIVAVGFSRIYFGVHYPSDVVLGWIAGLFSIALWHEICSRIEFVIFKRRNPVVPE